MKLKKEFIPHDAGEQSFLVPTGKAKFSGIVSGNRLLGSMLAMLKKGATEQQMIKALRDRYEAPEGVIEKDVRHLITELKKIGAIED